MPTGIPFNHDKDAIKSILQKHYGNISHAARELNLSPNTLRKHVKADEELNELLDDLRMGYVQNLVDGAEETVKAISIQRNDLGAALKASFFILNNLGKDRGYNHPNTIDIDKDQGVLDIKKGVKIAWSQRIRNSIGETSEEH